MPARRRGRRVVLALLVIVGLAGAVSCADQIGGSAVYEADDPHSDLAPVRVADLRSLVLSPADTGAVLNAPDLAPVDVPAIRTLPPGAVSEPGCGAVIQPGWQPTYRVSGYIGAEGLTANDPHERHFVEVVAAFRDAAAASAFVGAVIEQWKGCVERSVTVTADGSAARWMGFGPSRSDGIDVLLVRREGGRGYACSRAIGAGSNVTADVMVCGPDETIVNGQAARIVTDTLARLPS